MWPALVGMRSYIGSMVRRINKIKFRKIILIPSNTGSKARRDIISYIFLLAAALVGKPWWCTICVER
jgi:hypothetical protein